MATPEQEIERGQGGDPTSPPLPQGAATELDEAEVVPEEGQEEVVEEEEGDIFDDPDILEELSGLPANGRWQPRSEEERIVFGEDPQDFLAELRRNKRTLPPPPDGLESWLPALAMLARSPQAPRGARALYNTIIDALYPHGG